MTSHSARQKTNEQKKTTQKQKHMSWKLTQQMQKNSSTAMSIFHLQSMQQGWIDCQIFVNQKNYAILDK